MNPQLRTRFNANFTPERYRTFLTRLEQKTGTAVAFRHSETPCFFDRALPERMADIGRELIGQLMRDTSYLEAAGQTIPPEFRVPNEAPYPLFIQADFGLDEQGEPKLVEIQGFPSLYAYQPCLTETYREAYDLDSDLSAYLGDWTETRYHALLRETFLGGHDPENVVLLEIEPQKQKTLPDFLLTERLCGLRAVCITQVKREGKRLFYLRDGRLIPIERIYNRVIVDELVRKGITPGFDLRDELDVEWAGHPNWYFKISKFSLPFLRHPSVPETRFLSDIRVLPDDLETYVLKPLFSFAGLGVVVGPTREEVAAVADPTQMILQRRVPFTPVIETPHGPTKIEARVMYLWRERGEGSAMERAKSLDGLEALTVLIRMGRGKMMGVDQNRDAAWVGASAAFLR